MHSLAGLDKSAVRYPPTKSRSKVSPPAVLPESSVGVLIFEGRCSSRYLCWGHWAVPNRTRLERGVLGSQGFFLSEITQKTEKLHRCLVHIFLHSALLPPLFLFIENKWLVKYQAFLQFQYQNWLYLFRNVSRLTVYFWEIADQEGPLENTVSTSALCRKHRAA